MTPRLSTKRLWLAFGEVVHKILFPNVLVELEAYEMRVTLGQSHLPPELKAQHCGKPVYN